MGENKHVHLEKERRNDIELLGYDVGVCHCLAKNDATMQRDLVSPWIA